MKAGSQLLADYRAANILCAVYLASALCLFQESIRENDPGVSLSLELAKVCSVSALGRGMYSAGRVATAWIGATIPNYGQRWGDREEVLKRSEKGYWKWDGQDLLADLE